MYDVKLNLTTKDILEKEFKLDAKGYRPQEVDEYLDLVISDYTELTRLIKKLDSEKNALMEENNTLKSEIRKLKMEVDTTIEATQTGKFTSNNVDLLKRISNLEKIVYGREE